jgi:hypothetical protein
MLPSALDACFCEAYSDFVAATVKSKGRENTSRLVLRDTRRQSGPSPEFIPTQAWHPYTSQYQKYIESTTLFVKRITKLGLALGQFGPINQ